jgi:hypothetical protein
MPTPRPDRRAAAAYTRADAITDVLLFEVPPRLSRLFGFSYPVAVTAVAWFDAVAWDAQAEACKPRPTRESEAGRITDLLWAARQAADSHPPGTHEVDFTVCRVPPTGPHTRAARLALVLHVHQGDHGEPVATIGHPDPPHAGQFHFPDDPTMIWPAAGFDRDHTGRLFPVVTPDTLDEILTMATDVTHERSVDVTPGPDGTVHVTGPDGSAATLRPDDHGRYHLRPLGWPLVCREFSS